MSVLVVCRGLDSTVADTVEQVPVAKLRMPAAYKAALAAWEVIDPGSWFAVLAWRGHSWDDLVNEAVADPSGRDLLVQVLGSLARSCDEIAIWYAGFPDDVPIVETPEEFAAVVDTQLAAEELEPAARMIVYK